MNMKTMVQLGIGIIVTALLASTAFFLFPDVKAVHQELVVAAVFASSIMQLGAVAYFLLTIRTIKVGYKVAYILFALGILLFSILMLLPSSTVFSDFVANHQTFYQVTFVTSYAAGTFMMYLGMRMFARLLGVQTMWASFALALGISIALAALGALAVHYSDIKTVIPTFSTANFISYVSTMWSGAFGAVAALLALRVRRAIGPAYRGALTWSAAALIVVAFAAFHEFIVKLYFPISQYAASGYSLWPYLLVGLMLLITGMMFMQASLQKVSIGAQANYIDVVTSVAGMVSRPQDIDTLLDTVRNITASRTASQLTAADKASLVKVYLQLEKYLVTIEPLHKITVDSLRSSLPGSFLRELPTTRA